MKLFKVSIFALAAILLVSGCNTYSSTRTTTTTTIPPESSGCYIGAYVNGLSNTPAFETMIGRNLAINMWFINWDDNFSTSDCNTAYNYGAVPMITWEPFLNTTNSLEAISNGDYDTYITTFAQDAKSWNKLIYLRFAHEMNGDWYPWSGQQNGGSSGPAKYIAAWRHIHDIFTSVGVTNIKWIWSPSHLSFPNESWNEASDYYPGSAYVDWIGIDGYNWGLGDWFTFDEIFSSSYAIFSTYGKPIMIAEFASAEDGGDKAAWITSTFATIENDYPKIRAVNWFNIDKERDWRINSSSSAESAFKTAVSDSYFLDSRPSE